MQVIRLDTSRRGQVRRFVGLPFDLYRDCPPWCPPLRRDVAHAMDRERHPFYRHSDAEFFLAEDGGRAVGRIAVMENRRFNAARGRRDAFFYFFESGDDPEVAGALVGAAADWARARGLDTLIGPKGFLPGDGLGILVEGFEHPVAMGVPYHHPYYDGLLAGCGLEKETDYLIEAANRYLAKPLSRADVVWTFAGVRPLYDDGKSDPSSITRDYVLKLDAGAGGAEPPVLSIYGGKLTTYRKLAEDVLDRIAPHLGCTAPHWTAGAPLPGGDMPEADFAAFLASLETRHPWLPPALRRRYARLYGTRVERLLQGASAIADLGDEVLPGLHSREIDYLRDQEWAADADGILYRRTKLGLHVPPDGTSRLDAWLAAHPRTP